MGVEVHDVGVTNGRRHELKCWPDFFDALYRGHKTSEIRVNDRDFRVGDVIVFREFSPVRHPDTDNQRGYTGRKCARLVTHVLTPTDLGPLGGIVNDYVCLSLWRVTVNGQEVS